MSLWLWENICVNCRDIKNKTKVRKFIKVLPGVRCSESIYCSHCSVFGKISLFALFFVWAVGAVRFSNCSETMNCSHCSMFGILKHFVVRCSHCLVEHFEHPDTPWHPRTLSVTRTRPNRCRNTKIPQFGSRSNHQSQNTTKGNTKCCILASVNVCDHVT